MFSTIKIIYDRLVDATHGLVTSPELDSKQVVRFLKEKKKIDPTNTIYSDLIAQITALKTTNIPISFIERYCLSLLSEKILANYPVNVAEAFILAYVALNEPADLNQVYFKVGNSGLLAPTLINGEKIQDIEAITQFMIDSLDGADLISILHKTVLLGSSFSF